jgi:predicted nucleic acid-binding protein
VLKLYLDSSVFGYAANERAGDKYADANLLLRQITGRYFEGYVSEVVEAEIKAAHEKTREILLGKLVPEIIILEKKTEVLKLARDIISAGIVPGDYFNDAVHIAYTVQYELDVLLSYNYKHLVNLEVELALAEFLKRSGRKVIHVRTPAEVVIYD